MNNSSNSSIDLTGKSLGDGWKIFEKSKRFSGHTGARYSDGYIAKHENGQKAFLKILRLSLDESLSEDARLNELRVRIQIFEYEQGLCDKCFSHKMKRVVRAIKRGSFSVSEHTLPFYYILFEYADNDDLRKHLEIDDQLTLAAQLRVLQQSAVALKQLHWVGIAHQDMKPSNVLLFRDNEAKIGDLGHAHDRTITRPGNDNILCGDPTYAPLEQLYQYRMHDWECRRLAADLYQLGCLATWVFLGIGMTDAIAQELLPEHHWAIWTGDSYQDILPYLRAAHDAVLDDLSGIVRRRASDEIIEKEFISLVRYLTDPDPLRRGHPRNLAGIGTGTQYGLERIESKFNLIASKAESRALV